MKERPILFRAEMVRAILENRKFQTRRVIKQQPLPWATRFEPAPYKNYDRPGYWIQMTQDEYSMRGWTRCPYGVPGDRLWVKETWAVHQLDSPVPGVKEYPNILYRADSSTRLFINDYVWQYCRDEFKWRPSIFMPRFASRITLEIVSIKVERLQAISPNDVVAEGIDGGFGKYAQQAEYKLFFRESLKDNYAKLWDSINGETSAYSWNANPLVWVVEFRQVKNG